MKKISSICIFLLLFFISLAFAQTPNNLIGELPIAIFASGTSALQTQLNDQIIENSYGKTSLKFTSFAPIPLDQNSCNWPVAKPTVQAHPGFYVYIFYDPNSGCNGGTAWSGPLWTDTTVPGLVFVNSLSPYTVGHELSHALGLYHYESLHCDTQVVASTCYESGSNSISGADHYTAPTKEQFGWLPLQVKELNSSDTVTLTPIETVGDLKAVKIPYQVFSPTETGYLYFHYRAGLGLDSGESIKVVMDYSVVTIVHSKYYTWKNYRVGSLYSVGDQECFVKEGGDIAVKLTSLSGAGAILSFTFGQACPAPPPCVPEPTQTQTIRCPPSYKGEVKQQRVSTCPGPTWGPWVTISSTCVKKGKGKN